MDGQAQGELGALLDGFPRTRRQAQMLALIADTQLAVNLSLRPEVSTDRVPLDTSAVISRGAGATTAVFTRMYLAVRRS